MGDNIIEEIVKNLSDLITQERKKPSKKQFVSIGKEANEQNGLSWTDASVENKLITPVDPNKGLKAKIRNWIKKRLSIAAKQTIAPALQTQQKFNHEVIDNFNRVIEKIQKTAENDKLLAESLKVLNQSIKELQQNQAKIHEHQNELQKNNQKQLSKLELTIKQLNEHIQASNDNTINRLETLEKAHRKLEKTTNSEAERITTIENSQRGIIEQIKEVENPTLDFDYLSFEDKYRGPQEEIRKKQMQYIPYFKDCKNVVDIGCGRGEFLELLREHKSEGIGIDLNQKMVDECKRKKITAHLEDALEFLKKQEDESLDGIINMQVIEHLKPKYVMELIRTGYKKLKPGAYFIAETVNPMCLDIYRSSFVLDITHERPYHPETVHFLMMEAGFSHIEIKYCSPIPDENILHYPDEKNPVAKRNVDLLNAYICNHHEYAAIAKK